MSGPVLYTYNDRHAGSPDKNKKKPLFMLMISTSTNYHPAVTNLTRTVKYKHVLNTYM